MSANANRWLMIVAIRWLMANRAIHISVVSIPVIG